jgi:hypothetical protein
MTRMAQTIDAIPEGLEKSRALRVGLDDSDDVQPSMEGG